MGVGHDQSGALCPPSTGDVANALPLTEAERLDAYRIALEFHVPASTLAPNGHGALRDQLERASVSVVPLLAERAGRRLRRDKRRFYSMARGSTMKTAAVVSVLYLRQLASIDDGRRTKVLAVRIIRMISKLKRRMAS